MPKHTFTLFLIKEDIGDIQNVFSDPAKKRIESFNVAVLPNPEYAEDAVLYIFQNPPRSPKWLIQIEKVFDIPNRFSNQSTSAVLLFKSAGRLFAVTFGYAWLYLNPAMFVPDFGLRVALNAADDSKLRRLDIAHLGEAIKGVTQSASQRRFDTFGVDEALELVRKIGGSLREEEFGSSVSGSNSLKLNTESSFDEVPDLAERALGYFRSEDYKRTPFRIIDNISPEHDISVIEVLDEAAARSIAELKSEFELGLPEFSEDDYSSFGLSGFNYRNTYSDLRLAHYAEVLGARLGELDATHLKRHRIRAEFLDDVKPPRTLRIYDALVGSVEVNGLRYAINEGKWYRIDAAFKEAVDNIFYSSVLEIEAITPPLTRIEKKGRKQYLEPEKDYNERYAAEANCMLFDRVMFDVPDVARSNLELCDLLDARRKRLIHVKMSGRKSSVLSHLFKQGTNSATVVKSVEGFWNAVLEKVRERFDDQRVEELRAAIEENNTPWTVEFHIADAPSADGKFTIPFFSRVTFREERRRMQNMGFDVAVRFLPKPDVNVQV